MKLIIYDKCWDAIIELPKTIQKKVPEFIKKFREDSKSAAIHLEPISTFKDSSLRTARIDRKYRAIIRVPDSGDMYHLLWIDNHDEAMAWAANKVFEWNDNTQSYQVFTAPEIIAEKAKKQPEVAPEEETTFMGGFSDDDLVKIGVPPILLPSVKRINGLKGLEVLEEYLPVEAFENLFYLIDGMDIRDIIMEVEQGKVNSDQFEAQTQSANNQRSFFELTDDEVLNDILSGDLQKWRIFLHPSQRTLVEGSFKGATKVTGGAGTGKTVAALHRAKFLQDNALPTGSKPILFTTFTKSLTRNLGKEFNGMGIDPLKVHLNNIDAFAVETAKGLGVLSKDLKLVDFPGSKSSRELWDEVLEFELSEFDSDFLEAEYKDVFLANNLKTDKEYFKVSRIGRQRRISRKDKMEIWKLFSAYQALKNEQGYADLDEVHNLLFDHYSALIDKPYSYLIADEIQDFSNVKLRLLRALVAEGPNDLFLVGDPMQKIYQNNITFSKAGINIRGRRSRRLKINYRTTEEIKRSAIATVQNLTFDNFDGETESKKGYVSLRHGLAPSYETFSTKDQELDFLIKELYKLTNLEAENAVSFHEICLAARTRNGIKDLISRLHQEKIPYYDITTDTSRGDVRSGVRLSTFHNMKGLEFKAIFLVDINQRTMPFHPNVYDTWDQSTKDAHDQRERALLYVAMTRAVQLLHITGVGVKSSVLIV